MKTLHTAIRRLDPASIAQLLPESLKESEIEALLLLADEAAAKEIGKAAFRIAKTKPENIASLALAHSLCMQNYLSVRAVLRGDTENEDEAEDDDFGNIGIF